MIKKMLLACVVAFAAFASNAQDAGQDKAIHEELRAVLKTVESAINSGDYDKMLPVLSEQIRATPVNQEFLTSRSAVSTYFKKWFGPGGYLKKLEISLSADVPTELSADRTWGLAYGSGIERYVLADGRKYDIPTRWTATLVKEEDEKWRIRGIQLGANFLDNPLMTEVEGAIWKAGFAAGGGCLIVGLAIGWFLGRRKKVG